MRNSIDDIICSFSRDELRQFKYFIKRNGNTEKEKDLQVVDQIRKNAGKGDARSNAHLQIRKRLKTALAQFALLENLRYDTASEINSLIEMSKYLFRKNLHEHAWNCLFKAEKMALRLEEYEFLDFIYRIQISYSSIVYMPGVLNRDTPGLIDNREKNLSLAKMNGDANAAYALLLHKIRENSSSPWFDINKVVGDVLKHYQLDDKIYSNPKIYLRVIQIVGKALHEQKEFARLQAYAMSSYETMSKKKMLKEIAPDALLEIMFYIYTSAIKTKDYKNTEKFLNLYIQQAETQKMHRDRYLMYSLTANVNMADLYLFTNRLTEARDVMLHMYKKYGDHKSSAKPYFLLRLNLIAIHFKCGEYKKCIKLYNDVMQQPVDRLLKIGGFEIVLFTEIYGALIHYENDDADYAMDLLKRIRSKYANEFAKGLLKRELMFIKIMENMINKPFYLAHESFGKHLARFGRLKEYIPGDKEYISLEAWLVSKQARLPYYPCFLDAVK